MCLEGGSFLVPFCLFLVTLVVFVFWSRLRRVTFQRWKVTKDRRACGPGPGVGGRRWRYGACKSFGCYPPFKPPPSILRPLAPRADIPLAKLGSSCPAFGCTHAAFRTANRYRMDLGLRRRVFSALILVLSLLLVHFVLSVRSMLSELSILHKLL